jgi:hypothetical protein
VALAVLAAACAVLVQPSGPNQAAHYALVRSLADGTAEIDPGETIDASYVDGRFFAAKAPGLAMFTLPWYAALRAVGLQDAPLGTAEGYSRRLWEVSLFGALLPTLALLLLIVVAVERVAPGFGGPTAILLGAGTLLLPFATLFFDHALSAAVGFAAFVVLLLERQGPPRTWLVGAAGLLAGLAVVVEFPLALVALVLAGYAAGSSWLRRVGAYTAGLLLGVAPLLAYNTWAFGSPTTLSYTNALEAPVGSETPIVGANEEGLYGVGLPDPRAGLSLLLSEKGLAVVSPLAIVALAGLPMLWRSGRRGEALVCGAVPLLFLAYNAAYYLPWGGQGPGPRFLVPALPFLALPLAMVLRARPLVVVGIAVVSVGLMALATITDPLVGEEHGIDAWWDRLRRSELVDTVPTRAGVDSPWVGVALFLVLLGVSCAVALAWTQPGYRRREDGALLAAVLAAWGLLALAAPDLLPATEENGTLEGTVAVVLLVATLGAVLLLVRRGGALGLLPLVPALALAVPALDTRPRVALLVVVSSAVAAAIGWWLLSGTRRGVEPAEKTQPAPPDAVSHG